MIRARRNRADSISRRRHEPEGETERDRRRLGRRGLLAAGWRALLITALLASTLLYLLAVPDTHGLLFDFKGGLYNAGLDIIHGHSPYQPAFLAHQVTIMRTGAVALGESSQHAFSIPVYPAPINLAVVPLSLLPLWLAGALFTCLAIAAMILGLRLLGVRDWRCIAVALASWPFVFALDLGALGPLLVLGAGVTWRWRDRLWPPALAIAALVVAKIFPWPLGVWLLITRRFRALALAVAIGAVVTLAAWAVIGFAGLAQYPQMLSDLSLIQEGRAVSLVAVLIAIGLSPGTAGALALATAAALLVLAWRISHRPEGERRAFGLAIIAALTATPIVWEHYMVLLFVPIALLSPRFSSLWLLPLSTPLILTTSFALFPGPGRVQVTDTRAAALWLLLQVPIIVRLCVPSARLSPRRSRLPFGSGAASRARRAPRVEAA